MQDVASPFVAEGIGRILSSVAAALESEARYIETASTKHSDSCEENVRAYRFMLEKDDCTFGEKQEIHGWIMKEKETKDSVNAAQRERNRKILGKYAVVLVLCAAIVFIADSSTARGATKQADGYIPKAPRKPEQA